MEDWRSTGDLILATFSSRMAQRTNGVTKHRTARTMHSAHSAHCTTSRHEWRVTGHFAPSSVRPIDRIQHFMLIQLKPKHVFRCASHTVSRCRVSWHPGNPFNVKLEGLPEYCKSLWITVFLLLRRRISTTENSGKFVRPSVFCRLWWILVSRCDY